MPGCDKCNKGQNYAIPKHGPVPEPHFIPGYTGHCPDLPDQVGLSYPWATYAVLSKRPELAMRLSAMRPVGYCKRDHECKSGEEKAKRHCYSKDESSEEGFMPKMMKDFCESQKQIFRKVISDLEKHPRKTWKIDESQHSPGCSTLGNFPTY